MTNRQPKSKRPVVDKLAYVLKWGHANPENINADLEAVKRRVEKGIEAGALVRAYLTGSRYRENIYIPLDGGSRALVQVGALQPRVQKGGIRIEVNPAKFVAGDVEKLHRIMKRIIGNEYFELLTEPLINKIDFAVDVYYLIMDDIIVSYKFARHRTMFGKHMTAAGHIESYNFGSVKSDHGAAVYAKNIEQVNAALLSLIKSDLGDDPLKSNSVRQFFDKKNACSYVRAEVRGKKMRGLAVHKLNTLPNRFERFCFWHFDPAENTGYGLPDYIIKSFMALCRQDGFKSALAAFKDTKWNSKINSFADSRKANWWQPKLFWKQACDALKDSGLFPEEAFIEPKP